ncbi:Uncharacterised protein [Moraxella caprae]|uniref:Uncharacterized protein n=1 Tax=Moraxella caprae TaxID=90240 RepID=A0A378QXR9_9GAMM|nr:hypothetical protein [Moraxella caprae]STZ07201.1 Uncharacterised protein [Moraxella caprae]
MTNSLIILAISTVLGLVQAVFWRWVSNLSDSQKSNTEQINAVKDQITKLQSEIYRDYPSKADVHKDSERIMQSLQEIKTELGKVNDKLDKKADK